MPLVTIFCEKENFLKNFVKKELHKNRGDGKKVYLGGIFLHPILVEIVYMMKKVLMLASAFTAGAFAANSLQVSLDVVVRDFQPSHPDFENFSEESVKQSIIGKDSVDWKSIIKAAEQYGGTEFAVIEQEWFLPGKTDVESLAASFQGLMEILHS